MQAEHTKEKRLYILLHDDVSFLFFQCVITKYVHFNSITLKNPYICSFLPVAAPHIASSCYLFIQTQVASGGRFQVSKYLKIKGLHSSLP